MDFDDFECSSGHCQNLGQQRSEPDPGFEYLFFYILVFDAPECIYDRSGSVISTGMDNTPCQLHVASGFLQNDSEFIKWQAF